MDCIHLGADKKTCVLSIDDLGYDLPVDENSYCLVNNDTFPKMTCNCYKTKDNTKED